MLPLAGNADEGEQGTAAPCLDGAARAPRRIMMPMIMPRVRARQCRAPAAAS